MRGEEWELMGADKWKRKREENMRSREFFLLGEIQQVYMMMGRIIARMKMMVQEKEDRMAIVIPLNSNEVNGVSHQCKVVLRKQSRQFILCTGLRV